MKNTKYLLELLDSEPASPLKRKLQTFLSSQTLVDKPADPQRCTVEFVLNQAQRRSISITNKETFGIEDLIIKLNVLPKNDFVDAYIFSDREWLGTCYVAKNRYVGCEFVSKGGTQSLPGLWVDGRKID